nr:tmv resistance protein n [Quercus suber]
MPRSHIEQLPEGLTNLAKLRLLDLSDSKVLVKTPNFIGCPNLERLIFQGCTSLFNHLNPGFRKDSPSFVLHILFSKELDLSENNFKRLPDSISQLSKLKSLMVNDCCRLQSLPDLPLSVGYVRARRCPLLEKYSNQDVAWTSGETGFTGVVCNNKDDDQIALIRFPILPYDDFDPFFERYVEGEIQQNKGFCGFSNSTETPEWFSHQSPGSSVTIPLPSDLRDDSSWIGIALFTSVVILENLNNVSSAQDDEVSIDFICRSDIIEVSRINFPINVTGYLPVSFYHASSFGLKVLIPAGILKDHLKDCSCIRAFIRSKCTYFEIKMCGARVLYEQDLVKFMRASGKVSPYSFT